MVIPLIWYKEFAAGCVGFLRKEDVQGGSTGLQINRKTKYILKNSQLRRIIPKRARKFFETSSAVYCSGFRQTAAVTKQFQETLGFAASLGCVS